MQGELFNLLELAKVGFLSLFLIKSIFGIKFFFEIVSIEPLLKLSSIEEISSLLSFVITLFLIMKSLFALSLLLTSGSDVVTELSSLFFQKISN